MNEDLLNLCVTGLTDRLEQAVSELRRICEEELDGRYDVDINEVLEHLEPVERQVLPERRRYADGQSGICHRKSNQAHRRPVRRGRWRRQVKEPVLEDLNQ